MKVDFSEKHPHQIFKANYSNQSVRYFTCTTTKIMNSTWYCRAFIVIVILNHHSH
ncbi:hypothetical protein ALP49_200070 [Pseudomonas syringae pv. solidagae]|nr:hypothetical protein ALP49_200070 [Pseudomonas syringae pv. solidagae]